ncbi:MAG: SUMF1/EgtB/PvdO family nonheme iron enzyme [Alphaproteobacteria bacterium]|nr:SUMF1/EgtB/PvdO family nonheme iron enzyme [Alphaproteobacteria bacterium]MCB9796340.1 SUMF1/EgtB/PvdO family nonheme iron enzyme [Alphaproteobacteria bacterium]
MLPHDAPDRIRRWLLQRQLSEELSDELLDLTRGLVTSAFDMTQPPLALDDTVALPPEGLSAAPLTGILQAGEPPIRVFEEYYEDLGLIGQGGMGEVRRVRDRVLQRVMVAKLLREDRLNQGDARARFLEEAQITAQLQHANIVPVHELAQGPDQRPWFTMKEVRGRTLKVLIHAVHAASEGGEWRPTEEGWNFRRLVDDFRRACEAVAYAHGRGVTHRDLKPSNVMISAFGEVLVVDWGLAKVGWGLDAPLPPSLLDAEEGEGFISTRRSASRDINETAVGTVAGTLAYMPLEQALGDLERIGPRSDVYSLGAMLYELLAGVPPYANSNWDEMWRAVVRGPPPKLAERPGAERMPRELVEICERAMARDPEDRFSGVPELLVELSAWIEGARKRDEARRIVAQAKAMAPEIEAKRAEAQDLRAQAKELAKELPQHGDRAVRLPLWALEDRADEAARALTLLEFERERTLRAAFGYVPDFEPAHQALADQFRLQHEAAERARDRGQAERMERMLRLHDRGRHKAYLRGTGLLSLRSDPPGAIVDLYEFVEEERQLRPRYLRTLGQTPLAAVELPIGSYVLRLRHEGYEDCTYPVLIEREGHWRHDDGAQGLRLLPAGSLGPDDVYVPAGWAWVGDQGWEDSAFPWHRAWIEGFIIQRFQVTNAEYIAYMEDLVAQGREEEALAASPRLSVSDGGGSTPLFELQPDGRFRVLPDEEGDTWDLGWPVFRVSALQAEAYARWASERSGHAWRLPCELEWEKAARGVDGRRYPWGAQTDASFSVSRTFFASRALPLPARDPRHASDVSVYGVRGTSGNVADWCAGPTLMVPVLDLSEPGRPKLQGVLNPEARPVRGGIFTGAKMNHYCSYRKYMEAELCRDGLGFRLARDLP